MNDTKERLTILSESEWQALYALPDFHDDQRLGYFAFDRYEFSLALLQPSPQAKIYCALQLAYFKAKQAFFVFSWHEVDRDTAFVLKNLFPELAFIPKPITKYQHYAQRDAIIELYGFRLWSKDFAQEVLSMALQLAKQDITPRFIVSKILAYLADRKIVRPSYRTLQDLVSQAITTQRTHLRRVIREELDNDSRAIIQKLLTKEEDLSGLAALKEDAKNFSFKIMRQERQKLATLKSVYLAAKRIVPKLGIAQQNVDYYASLVNFYTIYDLGRFDINQTYLYLLCYIFKRYQQITDNVADALFFNIKQLEDIITNEMNQWHFQQRREESRVKQKLPHAAELLLLYLSETLSDDTVFGDVRQCAFSILSQEEIRSTAEQMRTPSTAEIDTKWNITDKQSTLVKRRLRPLVQALDFSSTIAGNHSIEALAWIKQVFSKGKRLCEQSIEQLPSGVIPKKLRPHLLSFDEQGIAKNLHGDRFEFWLYRRLKKYLLKGELCLKDSIKELSKGKLKHLEYDTKKQSWHLRKSKADKTQDALYVLQHSFYESLPFVDIADVLHFANENCDFLSTFTPLLPRYAKSIAHEDNLFASILAKAFNLGNLKMSEMSDIPYHTLETTAEQYLRLSTLQAACDMLSNSIASLPIYPHFSFDLETLYGAVDGQKFAVDRPTTKARYSKKYFGRGKGVVAYSLLTNHIPLTSQLISANEHESHFVFDLWYNNTSNIIPDAITGDMHAINKMNFAIMDWFGAEFRPRFTSPNNKLSNIYCSNEPKDYEHWILKPAGQINRQLIIDEKNNIDRIILTLGLKETRQSILVKKMCTYTRNRTFKAIVEYDKIIRSIYTLKYFRDRKMQGDIHHSQNRLESYHQLRAAIARVSGKKQMGGKTDIECEISNQCSRLVANAIIYYNACILSKLFEKLDGTDSAKIEMLKKLSPIAWQHIHMLGHYIFHNKKNRIDLDALIKEFVF